MFSRSAQAEAEKKSFGVSKSDAIRIHEQLQLETEQTIIASGLPFIRSTEATQRGNSFGQRLTNAVLDCWAKGYQKLIVVGGDTPELSAADIGRAYQALQAGHTAVGNNFRGGSFLIGLQKDSFRQNEFAALPWQTNRLGCALKKELSVGLDLDTQEVLLLGYRADCNLHVDLIQLAKRSASSLWTLLLFVSAGRVCDSVTSFGRVSRFGESTTSRGPPAGMLLAA
jgi:glycosyltransferase A (GT-A) superfamily protein (DUF2064 family)